MKAMPMSMTEEAMEGETTTGAAPGPTGDPAKDGYDCLNTYPLTGSFWVTKPKHGEAE